MNNSQILRAYSINEVSKQINIPTGTIRQWERDLQGLLIIPRTKQGARYYTEKEITLLNKIKEMREQDISKGMIRSLLKKHMKIDSEPTSETFEMTIPPVEEISIQTSKGQQTDNMLEFNTALETFKENLLSEIKNEMDVSRNVLIEEIKNEFINVSFQTVDEISKSIQRSDDKRKVDVHEISEMVMKASERTSETFAALSVDIVKDSKATFEKLSKRMDLTVKVTEIENQNVLEKVSNTVQETKDEIRHITQSFDTRQDDLIESLNDLKQSTGEIKKIEEVFKVMISTYRDAAAAKEKKKKWWQLKS
ncbi:MULTISPECIES: MerR family transcriptional regulator [Bacillaceae]|uniref:DNA-binding transcriptional MerR regulator n=1 Tax=Peribacillus huizhouensis TaxID=1501239 RepID=A0ABR6CQ20_9BACI|nr:MULTISPECIES: MerR family transcriptional regulator [Bacillaceae]MBA9027137.1 DNA-binding transcriptional MerR regulator [Peribacillus huizhouensis]